MGRSTTNPRLVAALLLLGLLAAVFISLGNWQLNRAEQREAIASAIDQGRKTAPLELSADTPASELVNWRPAAARGRWLDQFTVLLENRNFEGRPGFWVATPLLIEPASRTAVLVLRGWLPRPTSPDEPLPSIAPQGGLQHVQGELIDRVPRLFELWSFGPRQSALPEKLPTPDGSAPKVQNLALDDYARATGLDLMPAVLEQTSGSDDSLGRQWPQPSMDADRNKGYALQWFSFAGIAIAAWIAIAWRALRPARRA